MRKGNSITTYTGVEFYPLDPRINEVSIRDIGHALSLLCRANGHYSHFYSVAQHSLNCAKEAKAREYSERVQLACLLHDASEAYLSDITRPIKKQLTTYLEIEEKLQSFIYSVYGLADLTEYELDLVNNVDDDMLKYEMNRLLHSSKVGKGKLIGEYDLQFVTMSEIEDEFISLVEKLHKAILPEEAIL